MLLREQAMEYDLHNNLKINRVYKDRLFRMLFGSEEYKENALSLYNALNNTDYTNADDLKFTTIQDVIYLGMKNDVSLMIDDYMNLWEQQSTPNENMALRGFMYFGALYENYIDRNHLNIYGKKRIGIPTPKYVVLYNGNEKLPSSYKQKLSDSFIMKDPETAGEFEWTATVININRGSNTELLRKCPILGDYMTLINRINDNRAKGMTIDTAVDQAVVSCIEEGIMTEFLVENRQEVVHMCMTEFNEKAFVESIRAESKEEGIEKGREEGREEGQNLLAKLISVLLSENKYADIEKVSKDPDFRKQMLKKYALV